MATEVIRKPMDTLVVLGSSITGLAVARDGHRHGLAPIVIDSVRGPACHSRLLRFVPVSPTDEESLLFSVMALASPTAAIVATGDHWIRWLARHRYTVEASFGLVLHPSNEVLDIFLDKARFAEWCRSNSVPCPLTWEPDRAVRPPGIRFPLLVRPAETLHAQRALGVPKAAEVRDEPGLDGLLAMYRSKGVRAAVSESLLGRNIVQYSVPFARRDGETLAFVARKVRPLPSQCGVGSFVVLDTNRAALDAAVSALDLAGYFGIGEVEVLQDADSGASYLIEVNCRPWLQYALAPASGHDLLGFMLGAAPPGNVSMPIGGAWLNLGDDLFGAFSRSTGIVRRGQLGLAAYCSSLFRARVFALLDWRDMGPFIASVLRR
jgi:predicted ATP-grasp superfamily ATP-dependent carboligase